MKHASGGIVTVICNLPSYEWRDGSLHNSDLIPVGVRLTVQGMRRTRSFAYGTRREKIVEVMPHGYDGNRFIPLDYFRTSVK